MKRGIAVVSQLNCDYLLACWAFLAAHRRFPSPKPSPQILVAAARFDSEQTMEWIALSHVKRNGSGLEDVAPCS
jgi:hypothetical protein